MTGLRSLSGLLLACCAKAGELPPNVHDCGDGWFSKITSPDVNAAEVCRSFGYTSIDMFGGNGGRLCSRSNDRSGHCGWHEGMGCGTTVDWHCTTTQWIAGLDGQSCTRACAGYSNGCNEKVWPTSLTEFQAVLSSAGYHCRTIQEGSWAYNPDVEGDECYWRGSASPRCSGSNQYVRFCPCESAAPTTTTTSRPSKPGDELGEFFEHNGVVIGGIVLALVVLYVICCRCCKSQRGQAMRPRTPQVQQPSARTPMIVTPVLQARAVSMQQVAQTPQVPQVSMVAQAQPAPPAPDLESPLPAVQPKPRSRAPVWNSGTICSGVTAQRLLEYKMERGVPELEAQMQIMAEFPDAF